MRLGGAYTPMIHEIIYGASEQHCSGVDGHIETRCTVKSNSSSEFMRLADLQSRGLASTCKESCGRLLSLLNNLASKQRVLDGDLSGSAYDDALYAVWLERHACEAAARVCRKALSAQHLAREGMCAALEEYSSAIWELA